MVRLGVLYTLNHSSSLCEQTMKQEIKSFTKNAGSIPAETTMVTSPFKKKVLHCVVFNC